MKPDDWLHLANKHIEDPGQISNEDLLSLRSNHQVWKMAIDYCSINAKNELRGAISVLMKGVRVTDEQWNVIRLGNHPVDLPFTISPENLQKISEVGQIYNAYMAKVYTARATQQFYQKYDDLYEKTNHQLPSDVQDMIWKQRAFGLLEAIESHRRAHVLANKQPNGLDFALWKEIDAAEYYASTRLDITLRNSSERV